MLHSLCLKSKKENKLKHLYNIIWNFEGQHDFDIIMQLDSFSSNLEDEAFIDQDEVEDNETLHEELCIAYELPQTIELSYDEDDEMLEEVKQNLESDFGFEVVLLFKD